MNNRIRMMQKAEKQIDKHVHYFEMQLLKGIKVLDAIFIIAKASRKSHSESEYLKLLKEEVQKYKVNNTKIWGNNDE